MNDKPIRNIHWSFWIIGSITLIWNILGGINFIMQMDADVVSAMPETARAIIEGRPAWATTGFSVSVFGGTFGCLLLLLRKSAAYYLFIASLLGTVVTMLHTVTIANSLIHFSPFEIVLMILMPLVVAAFLIWYAKRAIGKSWLS